VVVTATVIVIAVFAFLAKSDPFSRKAQSKGIVMMKSSASATKAAPSLSSPDPSFSIALTRNAFALDFDEISEAMSKTKDENFRIRVLYVMNTDTKSSVQFSFVPSGDINSFWCDFSGRKESDINNSDSYVRANLTEYKTAPVMPNPFASGDWIDQASQNGSGSKAVLTFIVGNTITIADQNLMRYGKLPPTVKEFARWYSSLDLQGIIAKYVKGKPLCYEFTSQMLASADIQEQGIKVTFLESSDGQTKEVNPENLEDYSRSLREGTPLYLGKTYFVLAPYYKSEGGQIGIWPQSYTMPESSNSAQSNNDTKALIANNLIVLLIDY